MSKTKAVQAIVSQEALEELRAQYPVEQGFTHIQLPRISFASQDKTEGKGKAMKVVTEAGTFFIERETQKLNEEGKKIWEKEELGTEIEATIVYPRKQLRMYDEATEQYTNSPVYDNAIETMPLFCDRKEVAKGNEAELKAMYEYVGEDGKKKSKLEENRVLYILYKNDLYQMTIRGSSMYSYLKWSKQNFAPSLLTTFSSEPMSKGSIEWNKMIFKVVRPLDAEEVADMLKNVSEIKMAIAKEKGYFVEAEKMPNVKLEEF